MFVNVVCVLRTVDGTAQFVAIENAANLVAGEEVIMGEMSSSVVRTGPSGSHEVTIWTPVGKFAFSTYQKGKTFGHGERHTTHVVCVSRDFNGHAEFVHVEDTAILFQGEKTWSGLMLATDLKTGPSGSHIVKTWCPVGNVDEGTLI